MKKVDAIKIFGRKQKDLARALGCGNSAISQWGDVLTERQKNIVIGAAVRRGIDVNEFVRGSDGQDR